MKKILFLSFLITLVWFISQAAAVQAEEKTSAELNFFYSQACPFCLKEKIFLNGIKSDYSEIKFNYYRLEDSRNLKPLLAFYKKYGIPPSEQGAVPVTFIGDSYFIGFDEEIGKKIEAAIQEQVSAIAPPQKEEKPKISIIDRIINWSKQHSFFILAPLMGFIDGFNICSLGAIVLILSLVLAFKSKKRTLIIGSAFILTTALIYGLLMVFWHQLFSLLVPWLRLMQILIGAAALIGGVYFLKQFFKFRKQGAVCEIEKTNTHSRLTSWVKEVFKNSSSLIALGSAVLLFAAVITIVEFPCSAAIPLAFTGILAESKVSFLPSLFYFSFYLLFYLLDEIVVFLIAVFTMKVWLAAPRFVTWLTLGAAIILIFLGGYYLIGI